MLFGAFLSDRYEVSFASLLLLCMAHVDAHLYDLKTSSLEILRASRVPLSNEGHGEGASQDLETSHVFLTWRPRLSLEDHKGNLASVGACSEETPTQAGMFWAVISPTREASWGGLTL